MSIKKIILRRDYESQICIVSVKKSMCDSSCDLSFFQCGRSCKLSQAVGKYREGAKKLQKQKNTWTGTEEIGGSKNKFYKIVCNDTHICNINSY